MNGLDSGFLGRQHETKDFSAQLITEFRTFIVQRGVGRPGGVPLSEGRTEEAISIVIKEISKLRVDTDIASFANAISYLAAIDQARVFFSDDTIGSPKTPDFILLRRTLINFLSRKTPKDRQEMEKYLWLYRMLDVKEPSFLVRKLKYNSLPEMYYLESIPVQEGAAVIKGRLKNLQ